MSGDLLWHALVILDLLVIVAIVLGISIIAILWYESDDPS